MPRAPRPSCFKPRARYVFEYRACSKPRTCAFGEIRECTGTWFGAAWWARRAAGASWALAPPSLRRHAVCEPGTQRTRRGGSGRTVGRIFRPPLLPVQTLGKPYSFLRRMSGKNGWSVFTRTKPIKCQGWQGATKNSVIVTWSLLEALVVG